VGLSLQAEMNEAWDVTWIAHIELDLDLVTWSQYLPYGGAADRRVDLRSVRSCATKLVRRD